MVPHKGLVSVVLELVYWFNDRQAAENKNRGDRKPLTVTSPLLVEQTGFTEAPPLSASVRHHPSLSSFTVQQGVHQHLHTEGELFADTSSRRRRLRPQRHVSVESARLSHLNEVV